MTELSHDSKTVDELTFRALKHLVDSGREPRLRIVSGSMAPLIPVGAEIQVSPIERKLEKFDIIVFWTGEVLMCHYIIHLNNLLSPSGENLIITTGINNRGEDWPVKERNVLGIVKTPAMSQFLRMKMILKRWAEKSLKL